MTRGSSETPIIAAYSDIGSPGVTVSGLSVVISFVNKFVHQQLDILPETTQVRTDVSSANSTRQAFINMLTNNGEYRNLPPIQRMSDPERMEQMRRKMGQNQQTNEDNERE